MFLSIKKKNTIFLGRRHYFSHISDKKMCRKKLVPRVCPGIKILKKFVRVTGRIFEICTNVQSQKYVYVIQSRFYQNVTFFLSETWQK